MAVDRVRQFRVVTPDGALRVANSCQNSELFWALRGGGGGTFGVVMEASIEIVPHPVPTVVCDSPTFICERLI
jgi:FAD/FMN-containing dehydrogenase